MAKEKNINLEDAMADDGMELMEAISAESQSQELGNTTQFADPESDGLEDDDDVNPIVQDVDASDPEASGEAEADYGGDDLPEDAEESDSNISADLMQKAKQYGMNDAQIEAYGDPEKLESALYGLDQQAMQHGLNAQQEQQRLQQQQQQQQQWQTQQAEKQRQYEEYQQQLKDNYAPIDIDPELVDPEVADYLQRIQERNFAQADQARNQMEAMQQQLMQSQQMLQNMHAEGERQRQFNFYQEVDSAIDGLPDALKEKFGEGSITSMTPNTPHFNERVQLIRALSTMMQSHAQAGRNIPISDAVRSTAQIMYPESVKQEVKEEFQEKVNERQSQFSQRGSSRGSRKAKGRREKALSRMDAWAAKEGLLD